MTHTFTIASGIRTDASEFPIWHDGRKIGTAALRISGHRFFGVDREPEGHNTLRIDVAFHDPRHAEYAVEPVIQNGRVRGVRTRNGDHARADDLHHRFDEAKQKEEAMSTDEIITALETSATLRSRVRKFLADHDDAENEERGRKRRPLDDEERVDARGADPEEAAKQRNRARSLEAGRKALQLGKNGVPV
jgi:hypothetical protein